jgi:hypothetical protein
LLAQTLPGLLLWRTNALPSLLNPAWIFTLFTGTSGRKFLGRRRVCAAGIFEICWYYFWAFRSKPLLPLPHCDSSLLPAFLSFSLGWIACTVVTDMPLA